MVTHFDAFARRFTVHRIAATEDDVGLSRQELRVLGAIARKPDWKVGELARHMMLGASSLTSLLDRLAAKSMLKRERSEEDRRSVWVRLTPEGRKQSQQFWRRRFSKACRMLSALSEEDQELFVALMRKIGQGIPQEEEERSDRRKPRQE